MIPPRNEWAISRNNRWLSRAALVALGYVSVYAIAQIVFA